MKSGASQAGLRDKKERSLQIECASQNSVVSLFVRKTLLHSQFVVIYLQSTMTLVAF